MSDMTRKALNSSEVWREYLSISLKKEAEEQLKLEAAVDELYELQAKIASDSKLKQYFKALQNRFKTDEKYASSVDPKIVRSVLMLKVD
jgi:hypothetical protein